MWIYKVMKRYLLIFVIGFLLTACIPVDQLDVTTKVEPENQEISVVAPIKEFNSRITKKPFGIFITPETSPIQPERFKGYHTGVDVEYDDVEREVEIFAIADGVVEYSGRVNGYGGLLAIRHLVDGKEYLAIYGHLDSASLVAKDDNVARGQQIGILGKNFSIETDGERKHLHFALYIGSGLNLKGYVNTEEELLSWVDPRALLP